MAPGSPRSSEFDHTRPSLRLPRDTVDQSSGPVEAQYPLPGLHARRAGGQRNFALESATDEVVHAIGMHPLNSVCVARRSASRHPCTRESGRQSETLPRQRMDFLLLAPDYSRIVLRSTGFNTAAGRTSPTRRGGSRKPWCRACRGRRSPRTADSGSAGTGTSSSPSLHDTRRRHCDTGTCPGPTGSSAAKTPVGFAGVVQHWVGSPRARCEGRGVL